MSQTSTLQRLSAVHLHQNTVEVSVDLPRYYFQIERQSDALVQLIILLNGRLPAGRSYR